MEYVYVRNVIEMFIKRQLYKKYRLEGLSAYRAAIEAGYSHNTAWNAGKNIENRCNWTELFVQAGIDNQALIKLIQDGMNALKPISCDVFIKDNNGTLKVNKNSNDWIEYQDWKARHDFLITALKLMKKIEDKPLIDQSQHTHILVKVEGVDGDKIPLTQGAVTSIQR